MQVEKVDAVGRAGGLAAGASDQRQLAGCHRTRCRVRWWNRRRCPSGTTRNAIWPASFSTGYERVLNDVIDATGRPGGLASAAGDEFQAAGTVRPKAFVVRTIHAVADETGSQSDLARIIERDRPHNKIRKFTPLGVPGAGVPLRATSVRLPEPPDQMP